MAVPHEKSTTFLGKTNFRGSDKVFGVKLKDRRQHIYVVGKTGTGKSVLLKNMALQDIHAGRGVGIIDPHGEFVEELISQIPPERINDVIYFNPVDADYPIGFNVLEVSDIKYKHLVVSDLLGIFTKIWANVWSARMEYILQNCILALLDTPGTTLLGIPRILVDKEYREKIVAKVQDPVVRSFWVHEYETWRDQFRNEAIVPIQNKVGQFLNTSFVRNIVGQPTSTLNIPQVMNEKKILLVNVSKGRIGEDNSQLLGAMIITKIQLAAMERVRVAEEEREDFFLYVDEFQNFATDSFASILSEARKYRLDLTVAHQYTGQLISDTSTKVRDAVFGNVGTMIVFRVGAEDAEFLEKEFEPEFLPADIVNLPNYHIYLKLMVGGVTSRPFSAVTLPPLKFGHDPMMKEKIMRVSRERYARPRAEVEARILQWSGSGGEDGEPATVGDPDKGKMFETVCSNCGKKTTVPFKPDGKRPVYCLECLRKIEAGTLILLPDRMPQLSNRTRFADTLGGLGIEFPIAEIARPFGAKSPQGQMGTGVVRSTSDNVGSGMARSRSQDASAVVKSYPMPSGSGGRRQEFPMRRSSSIPQRASGERSSAPSAGSISRAAPRPVMNTGVIRSHAVVRAAPVGRSISLAELKPKENTAVPRSAGVSPQSKERDRRTSAIEKIDVNDLRKTLNEALEERKKTSPREEVKQEQVKNKNVIKPGERVKF
ncbi:MAG: CxxC-x17-CxxC domain-containing protein [Candidatus Sungiibacteriota bacterium]